MSQLPLFQSLALSVSEVTRYLRELLESDAQLQDVWVQGEISNFSRPSSGHFYFTIKDSGAALRCVMWRGQAARQTYLPTDGQAVEVHGYISIYDAGGQYQLYADTIRPVGEGRLYQEFLRLKALLEAEGLFAAERKRALPDLPTRIGVITSPTGAALRDILNTLRRRYPLAEVILAPTAVQGEEAPAGIVSALEALNRLAHPDVIILARGGGSLEDLWAFNDERVVRAIAASPAPVISGVGHETDFTLADFAADLRAPTPTAAAELATPDQAEVRVGLAQLADDLRHEMLEHVRRQRWSLNSLQSRLALRSPRTRLQTGRQHLDELIYRAALAARHRSALERSRQAGLERRLAALDPRAVMRRGYAVVSRSDGAIVASVWDVQAQEKIQVHLSDGSLEAQVQNLKPLQMESD
jgi:exodeoxyribonuclease VII large subunit